MRIAIDLQGAQAENRFRGIGRYSISFAKSIVLNRGSHDVLLALNGMFPESVEHIRNEFEGLLPREKIHVWHPHASVKEALNTDVWRRKVAVVIREAFLASLQPDVIHISSFFEGYMNDTVTSIHHFDQHIPISVTIYDFIPLVYPKVYLGDLSVRRFYEDKIDQLCKADLFLTISEYTQHELLKYIDDSNGKVVNVSTSANDRFTNIVSLTDISECEVCSKYNLYKPFVMYTGGIDFRKNIEGVIRAYAQLREQVRGQHQLAIICSISPDETTRLSSLAQDLGLSLHDIIFTGFVSDSELVVLYNSCKVFVFPSLYEGFGIPILEAMSCGCAVIAGDNSSLPEVVGCKQALFDSSNIESITDKLEEVLTDSIFRDRLKGHGLEQAERFSWDKCAARAIAAFEELHVERQKTHHLVPSAKPRLKLAYISPLPPERSGISGYSADLIPALSQFYDIDVVVNQEKVTDSYVNAHCEVRDIQWFKDNDNIYDRILYHFGNSVFHKHMFNLLKEIPGVVVLHDFFLSGIIARMSGVNGVDFLVTESYYSHGYQAARKSTLPSTRDSVIWEYPCNLSVLQDALGIIVHSEFSRELARHWYQGLITDAWANVPLVRTLSSHVTSNRVESRRKLGISDDEFLVCSFGIPSKTKLSHRLLEAWIHSDLCRNEHCMLIFVGDHDNSRYIQRMLEDIVHWDLSHRVFFSGWVENEVFRNYLTAADAAVQLRTRSRGETSAAVIDCLNYGIPTVVNVHGSLVELPDDVVCKLPDTFGGRQLVEALELLWRDSGYRKELSGYAKKFVSKHHAPSYCAERYFEAIESVYRSLPERGNDLASAIGYCVPKNIENFELVSIADAVNRSDLSRFASKQLFLDVSELLQRDEKTGIQRVVRNLLKIILLHPPAGYRVEPVFATLTQGYRYARNFTMNFLGCPAGALSDDPIEYHAGDIFLGLDLQPIVIAQHREFYRQLMGDGVKVQFVVYDLLCVLMPKHFLPGAAEMFTRWLKVVGESDGAICISRSVAKELQDWIAGREFERIRSFDISWFHLGAGLEHKKMFSGKKQGNFKMENIFSGRRVFLMVGTVEPRKGHFQVLKAFETLWRGGLEVNLVVVGKQGWLVEDLGKALRKHPEYNKRLFWLENASDESLDYIYSQSTCLIAASEGEGYGLPIIEGAQYGLPIIARDIPVFREVGGKNVFYFKGKDSSTLSTSLQEWLTLYDLGQHPCSKGINWLTWEQSAEQLISRLGIDGIADYSDEG